MATTRFGVKEVAEVILFDIVSQKPVLFFDTLKISNLDNQAQTVYASGGQGAGRIISWDYDRTAQFKAQDALLSMASLSFLAGQSATTGVTKLQEREVLTVLTGLKVTTTTGAPLNGAGNVITVYQTVDGKIHGGELTVGTITGNDIVVSGGAPAVAVGDKVIVYYTYNSTANAKTVTISADKFPGYYKLVGDTYVRNEAGQDEAFQIVMPKVKLMPNFTLTMDAGNVSVFDFNFEVFKDATTKQMLQMIKVSD